MHLSKRFLYFGIIAYSVALLVMQDWGTMLATTGTTSLAWLGKMGIDVLFIGMAAVRLFGPTLFAEDEDEDEVAIHAEDLHFSDTALFGFFLVNVLANLGYHGYETVQNTGAASFYYSLWVIVEAVAVFLSWVLWTHAVKAQRKANRKSKEGSTPLRKAS